MKTIAVVVGALLTLALAGTSGASSKVLYSFRTPSKNVYCMYISESGGSLRCDIQSGLKPRPPKPRSCHFDWGGSVEMNRTGRSHGACVSDSVFSASARVLRYGTTWTRGGFSCTSRTTGLTCRNASGHGWFLSRQRTRFF